jgi:hypothetical protein
MARIEQYGSPAVRRGFPLRVRVTAALVAVLGPAPGAAAQAPPPHSTPGGRPPVDEIRERARPLPIPTREPVERGGRPGPEGPQRRVPGRSATGRAVPGVVLGFAAAGALVAIAALARRSSRRLS